jgi:segregation and condensation protein B
VNKINDLQKEVEALLFASAKALSMEELTTLLRKTEAEIKTAADHIKKIYDDRDAPMMLVTEGTGYKIVVKDKYISTIQKIVVETELPKSIMETLAVIAYKHPALQSEITKIRTNKAYEHLKELEELGYISREKFGRTKKIKLTTKFFQYFDLPREKLKEAFGGFEEIEKIIEEKQVEAKKLVADITTRQEEERKADKQRKKDQAVESGKLEKQNKEMIGTLQVVDELPEDEDEDEEKLGDLDVVDVKKNPDKPKYPEEKKKEVEKKKVELTPEQKERKEKVKVETEELAKKVDTAADRRAEELLTGKPQPVPSEEGEEQVQEEEKPDDQAEMSEVQADDVVPGDEGETPRET